MNEEDITEEYIEEDVTFDPAQSEDHTVSRQRKKLISHPRRLGSLILAMIGFIADILGIGAVSYSVIKLGQTDYLFLQIIVLVLFFMFGVGLGVASLRGFQEDTLSSIIAMLSWVYVTIVSLSYVGVALNLAGHNYDVQEFLSFIAIIGAGLFAVLGLHVVVEDHDVAPLSVPIFFVLVFHMCLILYNVVTINSGKNASEYSFPLFLLADMIFFIGMTLVASAMYGDVGFKTVLLGMVSKLRD